MAKQSDIDRKKEVRRIVEKALENPEIKELFQEAVWEFENKELLNKN